ncbi:hypothetical protein F5X99DRAFT_391044 [Biscogniauxia marginata]|nr:hypothetical protein F5X99DRAFT_391044 [Biscogniauxia marginata]
MAVKSKAMNTKNLANSKDSPVEDHKHKALPRYAPFHPFMDPELELKAYKPRDLLNFAVKGFHGRRADDLNARQQDCRKFFVNRFNDRRDAYGQKISDADREKYERRCSTDVKLFKDYLDGFFFFGRLKKIVEVTAGFDVTDKVKGKKTRLPSQFIRCQEDDRKFVRIKLNIGEKNQLYDLYTIIGNLMYEMTRAWFFSFSCVMDTYEDETPNKCQNDIPNTMGFDWHGPLYQMLHRLVLSEIRRWDGELEALLEDDCPGGLISKSIRQRDQQATEKLDDGERKRYNRKRPASFAYNHLVQITRQQEVAVKPHMKYEQLSLEDMLHSQEKRRGEIETDIRKLETLAASSAGTTRKKKSTTTSSSSSSSSSSKSSPSGLSEDDADNDGDDESGDDE